MNRFLVLYLAPIGVLEEWAKTDPKERAVAEEKMRKEWQTWMGTYHDFVKETAGAGKTKKVTQEGVSDTKNSVMMYSIVEAESYDAVAKIYEKHPHLQIPQSSIEIMQINRLSGV